MLLLPTAAQGTEQHAEASDQESFSSQSVIRKVNQCIGQCGQSDRAALAQWYRVVVGLVGLARKLNFHACDP